MGIIEGIVAVAIIIFTFAVALPIIEEAIGLLQNAGNPTIDLISAGYLPIMAIVLFLAITHYLRPGRPPEMGQQFAGPQGM